jgi:hypothetical protein
VHATFQSETEKDDEEAIVLFDSFETHGFENTSMRTLDCEIVHDVSCSYLQGDYEQNLLPFIHMKGTMTVLKQISRRLVKPNQNCLMNKRIALMHIIWLSYSCSRVYEYFC